MKQTLIVEKKTRIGVLVVLCLRWCRFSEFLETLVGTPGNSNLGLVWVKLNSVWQWSNGVSLKYRKVIGKLSLETQLVHQIPVWCEAFWVHSITVTYFPCTAIKNSLKWRSFHLNSKQVARYPFSFRIRILFDWSHPRRFLSLSLSPFEFLDFFGQTGVFRIRFVSPDSMKRSVGGGGRRE